MFFWSSSYFGVLPREEALFKATVHGERDERHEPPVLQKPERGQERAAERFSVLTELAGLLLVDVVQKHRHDDHGQHPHACNKTTSRDLQNHHFITFARKYNFQQAFTCLSNLNVSLVSCQHALSCDITNVAADKRPHKTLRRPAGCAVHLDGEAAVSCAARFQNFFWDVS